jgi:hypothetical protein
MASEFQVEQAPRPSHTSVVYSQGDGRVIHIHEFIGQGFDPEECAEMALGTVKTLLDPIKALGILNFEDLRVLHVPYDLELRPGTRLRVDLASNELVGSEPQHPLVDAIERRRTDPKT